MELSKINEKMNLSKTESILKERAKGITIISQVHLDNHELRVLIETMKVPLTTFDQSRMIKILWAKYPYSCMVVTVFIGILKYDGNFWDRFRRTTSVRKTGTWKRFFLESIRKNNFVLFDETSIQKYINNILGHAGIPKENVGVFIEDVIIPAAENGMDAREICEVFRMGTKSYIKSYNLYKGVIDFIKLGDQVSLNLIDRCLKLWKEQRVPFYKNSKGYIPTHLLKGFDKYVGRVGAVKKTIKTPISKPRLKVDVGSLNLFIQIPIIKGNDGSLQTVHWKIHDQNRKKFVEIQTTKVELSKVTEFVVEEYQKNYEIQPNNKYRIELFFNNELETEQVFKTEELMLFNTKTNEWIGNNSDPFKEVYVVANNKLIEEKPKSSSQMVLYSMNGYWSDYTLIEIEATHTENICIGNQIVRLSNKDGFPYLIGKHMDHVSHEQLTVYQLPPTIFIPDGFTPFFNNKTNWNLSIYSKGTGKSERISLEMLEVVHATNGGVRISLDQFKILENISFGEFEVTLYGPLGTDITLNFLMGKELDLRITQGSYQKNKGTKTVSFQTHKDYVAEVIWPDSLNVRKHKTNSFMRSQVECSKEQYKIIVQFTNQLNSESLPLTIFTKPYDLRILFKGESFLEGSSTDRTKMKVEDSFLRVDLENPFLEGYKTMVNEIEIKSIIDGEVGKTFTKAIKIGKKSNIPLKYFSESSKENITLVYRIRDIHDEPRELIYVDNDWKLSDIQHIENDLNLYLTWKENFSVHNMQVIMKKLDRPQEVQKTFKLDKGQTNLTIKNLVPGYYLLEWSEASKKPFSFLMKDNGDQPSFHPGKSKIIKMDTSYPLTALTLLNDANGEEFEWNQDDFLKLIEGIKRFGTQYLEHLLADYDACCDFGIRNIDFIIDLLGSSDIEDETKEICLQLSGFQEWDIHSLEMAITNDLQSNVKSKFKNSNTDYFGNKSIANKLAKKSPEQLNILYQQTSFVDAVVKNFSITHAHIEFFKRIKQDGAYFDKIRSIIDHEMEFINSQYLRLKNSSEFEYEIFNEVNKRDYQFKLKPALQFPNLIAKVALFNRFLSISERSFSDKERRRIRFITEKVYEIEEKWLIHDLVYLSHCYERLENKKQLKLERRKKYEHPSFKWKESN